MRFTLVCIGLCFFLPVVYGQGEKSYKNVNEYVYHDETHFTILNTRSARLERKYKVMIRNEYAQEYSTIMLYYNKFQKIASLSVTLTDEHGKVIKRYGLKDAKDYQLGGDVASDSRVKLMEIVQSRYPYVMEVSYRKEYAGSLFYPMWSPVTAEKQEVESSTFIVSDPQQVGVRYKCLNIGEPEKEVEATGFRYTWKVNRISPFVDEPFFRESALFPMVYTAPVDFEMDGYKGNMSSWENFGKWINLLNSDKSNLKAETIAEVKVLCDGIPTSREKVKAVYRYMQQSTRYISIQLGIGGWQPFSAAFVHDKKYGDCKALSFYMKSLLEAVGIPSYYTLIRAGKTQEPVLEDFASAHFNHAILTVPLERDTIWLECTSQTNPFGYQGTFTSDRHGLMVTPEGGRLIRTRKYTEEDNVQQVKASLIIAPNGNASLSLRREFSGILLDGTIHLAASPIESDKRKWVLDHADYGNLELQQYRFLPLEGDEVPRSGYEVEGVLKGFCSVNGKRLFVTPFVFSTIKNIQLTSEQRQAPVEIRNSIQQLDTLLVQVPEGYVVESPLRLLKLDSPYGSYEVQFLKEGDALCLTRRFVLKSGEYPAAEYAAFKDFISQVQNHDRSRFVLMKP